MPLTVSTALFEEQFSRLTSFVEQKSGHPFTSFGENPYTYAEEGYKADVYLLGRKALQANVWLEEEIGSGSIYGRAVKALRVAKSNLVDWRVIDDFAKLGQQPEKLRKVEEALFALYHGDDDASAFVSLTEAVGQKYDLVSYFLFLKDGCAYGPVRPTFFEEALELIGLNFLMSGQCSWQNYAQFNSLLTQIQRLLESRLRGATFLDAHSFLWMLRVQMQKEASAPIIWRPKGTHQERQYWEFAADPRVYDIEAAVELLEWDWWTTREKDIRAGDRVVIWKTKGKDAWRGVVALGEVMSNPELSTSEESEFWKTESEVRCAPRVRVRYMRGAGLPLKLEDDAMLSELNVARANGGTVFYSDEAKWNRLAERVGLAGDSPSPAPEEDARTSQAGQGYSSNPAARRAVELHAMNRVRAHYEAQGAQVVDVSMRRPYDFHATLADGAERLVEVKGTTGVAGQLFFTANEIALAQSRGQEMVLAVVHGIELSGPVLAPEAQGGTLMLIEPWHPKAERLEAISYRYLMPPAAGA